MLPPVRHHLEKFVSILNLQNAICLRPFADACLLLLFVVLQHVLQCYIARLMNMHRICTPALPCSCLCSSSRTSDNGNDCCSSGLHLWQQTKISWPENTYFLFWHGVTNWERKRWCFQRTHGKSDEVVKRDEGWRAACWEPHLRFALNDIARFPPFLFLFNLPFVTATGQLVGQSSERRQRIHNCNSKYFSQSTTSNDKVH